MKETFVFCMAALLAGSVRAQTALTLSVESDGSNAVAVSGPGEVLPVQIVGVLSGDPSDGLAMFGVHLTNVGSGAINLAGPNFLLAAPVDGEMENFDRNLGVTNPPGPVPGPTGFGGTDDRSGGLLQIGGGQNTIGNSGPALYPVGPVVLGVANNVKVLAEGWFTVPANAQSCSQWILSLNTGFANVIDLGQDGPVFSVTAADVVIGDSLTIQFGCPPCPKPASGGACPQCDLNESGVTEGLDIAIMTSSANFGLPASFAAEPCADVNASGVVEGLDVAICASSACFGL